MNPQTLMDDMSVQWQRERAETQLTLGKLIDALEAMPADAMVANLCDAHSYRGYYSDLAFEQNEGTCPAAELLAVCRTALWQVFRGYKGGKFVMGTLTPIWVAYYGCTGQRLMALHVGGEIEVQAETET